jgi:hypothetical protein
MSTLTLEEQERWAYANGDFERAALLATAIDGSDDLATEIANLRETIDDLERELRGCDRGELL